MPWGALGRERTSGQGAGPRALRCALYVGSEQRKTACLRRLGNHIQRWHTRCSWEDTEKESFDVVF